jgi:hypothetical protein
LACSNNVTISAQAMPLIDIRLRGVQAEEDDGKAVEQRERHGDERGPAQHHRNRHPHQGGNGDRHDQQGHEGCGAFVALREKAQQVWGVDERAVAGGG